MPMTDQTVSTKPIDYYCIYSARVHAVRDTAVGFHKYILLNTGLQRMSITEQLLDKILVPIDGSDNAFAAASYAIRVAKRLGAKLLLIHVSQINQNLELLGFYGSAYPDTLAEYLKTARAAAQPWFERIAKEAKEANVEISSQQIVDGPMSIVGEVVNYAERNKVDLVVIGSRGRTGFKKLLLGSVASGVVTYSPCPVLVIK